MNGEWHDWEGVDEMPRWLCVDDIPSLSGESALALVNLLGAISESIDDAYANEIEAYRRAHGSTSRARSETEPWLPFVEQQLTLDLGDDDYF